MTPPEPRRGSSLAESRETPGTINGPGATASPARSADQPQSSWSQSTIESSIAPNAVEKSAVEQTAIAYRGSRRSERSRIGLGCERERSRKVTRLPAAAASTAAMRQELQPHVFA